MTITAAQLRADVYRILDQALASGEPVEVVRRGRRLRIVPQESRDKLAHLKKRPEWFVGDVEDVVGMDWTKYWRPGQRF